MKCFGHPQTDAVAVCANCGKALCHDCITKSASGKLSCSESCSTSISETEQALRLVRQKILKGGRLTAYFLFGAAFVFGVSAIGSTKMEDLSFTIFLAAITAVFIAAGFGYLRLAKNMQLEHEGRD